MAAFNQGPVVINSPQQNGNVVSNFKGGVAVGLGITQIIIGSLVVVFEVVTRAHQGVLSISFTGVWMGIFFIITGGIGVRAGKLKTRCLVISFMVLSIISAFLGGALLSYASVAMIIQSVVGRSGMRYTAERAYRDNIVLGMNGAMIVCGLTEFIIAIISSAFCCGGLCCRRTQPMQVMYVSQGQTVYPATTGPGQQVIMYPQQGNNSSSGQPMGYTTGQPMGYPQGHPMGYPQGQPMGHTETQQGMSQKAVEAVAPQQMLAHEPPPPY